VTSSKEQNLDSALTEQVFTQLPRIAPHLPEKMRREIAQLLVQSAANGGPKEEKISEFLDPLRKICEDNDMDPHTLSPDLVSHLGKVALDLAQMRPMLLEMAEPSEEGAQVLEMGFGGAMFGGDMAFQGNDFSQGTMSQVQEEERKYPWTDLENSQGLAVAESLLEASRKQSDQAFSYLSDEGKEHMARTLVEVVIGMLPMFELNNETQDVVSVHMTNIQAGQFCYDRWRIVKELSELRCELWFKITEPFFEQLEKDAEAKGDEVLQLTKVLRQLNKLRCSVSDFEVQAEIVDEMRVQQEVIESLLEQTPAPDSSIH
jgi:hypothetical protein